MKKIILSLAFSIGFVTVYAQSFSFDTAKVFHIPVDQSLAEVINNYTISVNGYSYAQDRNGVDSGALLFNGTTDYLEIDSYGLHIPTDEITIAFWVKPDLSKSMNLCMIMPNSDLNRFAISPYYSHNGNPSHFFSFGPYNDRIYDSANFDGEWHLITCTNSTSTDTMAYYVDGQLLVKSATANSFVPVNKALRIGGGKDNNFDGLLDDFMIYNIALSADQVEELYNGSIASVSDIKTSNLQVITYPNPVENELTVKLPFELNPGDFKWNLYSVNGKVVQSGILNNSTETLQFISDMSGIYFFEVMDRNNPLIKYYTKLAFY